METARMSNKDIQDYRSLADTCLNWDVIERNIYRHIQDKFYEPIDSHKIIERSDTNESLGVVGAGYQTIQNSQIWDALNESLAGIEYKITNVGHLKNGGKIFIQAEVGDGFAINGDKFTGYITMWSSHDGSSSCVLGDTLTRVWCSNTFVSSLYNKQSMLRMKVRHTKNASVRFDDMMYQLDEIFTHRKKAFADIERLANEPISDTHAKLFSIGFVNSPKTRGMNTADEIHGLFRSGIGNNGETKYDLFNGFTEYYTHGANRDSKTDEQKNKQFGSSELGHGAKAKSRVLEILSNVESTDLLIAKGRKILKEAEDIKNVVAI